MNKRQFLKTALLSLGVMHCGFNSTNTLETIFREQLCELKADWILIGKTSMDIIKDFSMFNPNKSFLLSKKDRLSLAGEYSNIPVYFGPYQPDKEVLIGWKLAENRENIMYDWNRKYNI